MPKFHPERHKVIGEASRIACEACWKAILDLAICWVCGEVIVRGEDVVSLGWCFWHRNTCFCCMLCKAKLDIDRFNTDERVDDETGLESERRRSFRSAESTTKHSAMRNWAASGPRSTFQTRG